MSRRRTFALLGGLYVSQYLGVGFFYTALVAILRERGVPLQQLGMLQVLGLLWGVKFLWAPLLDRYGSRRHGHYRGWLLVLQPAIVVGLLAVAPLDPVADFGMLVTLAGAVVLLSATQDIAADAIAVRLLERGDRGVGNGVQVAGGYLGNLVGGGAVLLVYDAAGWALAVAVLALLSALPVTQVLRFREPRHAPPPGAPRPGLRTIVSVFRAPAVATWGLLVMPLLWVGATGSYALVTPMLVDAGWSLSAIGLVTSVAASGAAMVAAAGSGVLVRRLGRKRALLAFTAVQAVAVLALLPLAAGRTPAAVAAAAVCLMFGAFAATSTVVGTVNMDLSRAGSAGTDFTVLTCVAFLISMAAGALALAAAGRTGYVPVITAAAALLVVGVAVAARLFPAPAPAVAPAPAERRAPCTGA